ncbi:hypothetical protein K3727_09590 [Rhodobacteraceae bacterium M382]|nr:hypothetical protein K3727_09590 [Rhodobacteraceae bacterium M382]
MTRVEWAAELANRGVQPDEIAKKLGIRRQTARVYLTRARKSGISVPYGDTRRSPTLEHNIRAALKPHAMRRGISPLKLAERLLEHVIQADLIDAVLDDLESNHE